MLKLGISAKRRLLSLLLALVSFILVGIIYVDNWRTRQTCEIPVLKKQISVGDVIRKEDLSWIEVGRYHLEALHLVSTEKQVVGKYAKVVLEKGEAINIKDLSANQPQNQPADKIKWGAISISTDYERCVGGLPQSGDWVSVKIMLKDPTGAGVVETVGIERIQVIAVQDKNGAVYVEKADGMGSEPAYVTFDATPAQQTLLLRGQYSGHLHLVMLPKS